MPPDDYERMCALDNLKRAYRWIQSSPDPLYKNYFRDAYSAYAASSDHNLRRLRKHLLRRAYDPGNASKLYFPKSSGILRPYTLLTVNDQIVYQACINIVAERLKGKTRGRNLKITFGHLYGGKTSKFFYTKWQDGYRAYSNAVLGYINAGMRYVANFDLAAFYDSVDHSVLQHFLRQLEIDDELIQFLCTCLRRWTSSTWTNVSNVIYHGHGIPQGPLSSGLLSEVVLRHIDDRGTRGRRTKYLRYVDDIKLFASSENVLRQRLVGLDLAAKEIGLFPQSSKINIRKVADALSEIKSVSRPPEPAATPALKQSALRKRLRSMIRQGRVKSDDLTRFKYLLARAKPHSSLNLRLASILDHQPDLAFHITTYFSAYQKLPGKTAQRLLDYMTRAEIYHAVHGSILTATLDNMQEPLRSKCADFCYRRLILQKDLPPPQPTYKAALIAWGLKNRRLTYVEVTRLFSNEIDWWVLKDFLKYVTPDHYGPASYEEFVNNAIRSADAEPARIGAFNCVEHDVNVSPNYREANESARLLLYAAGHIRHIGQPKSLVGVVLAYVLDKTFSDLNWRQFLGNMHKRAEHIAFTVKSNYESDINSCIVTLDSLCDLIWEAIFYLELPGKQYGSYGSMLKNPTLTVKYPRTSVGFLDLHKLRLESVTAHPRDLKTGGPTRRLKHADFYRIRPKVRDAIEEIIAAFI